MASEHCRESYGHCNTLARREFNEFVRVRLIGNGHALLAWGGITNATVTSVRTQGQDTFGASMNSGMITALAAISGSLVGALGSAVGTWITQRFQKRRDLVGPAPPFLS